MSRITLDALNALPADAFDAALAPLFENAPWVTAGLAAARPFAQPDRAARGGHRPAARRG